MGLAGVLVDQVWRKQELLVLAKIVSLFFVCLYSSLTSVGTSGKEEFPFATFSFYSAIFLPYLEMPLANFGNLV
jgi:hypothetical protein